MKIKSYLRRKKFGITGDEVKWVIVTALVTLGIFLLVFGVRDYLTLEYSPLVLIPLGLAIILLTLYLVDLSKYKWLRGSGVNGRYKRRRK